MLNFLIPAVASVASAAINKPKQSSGQKAAGEYQQFQLDNAKTGMEQLNALLPYLLQDAGYTFTPGQAGTPGTPGREIRIPNPGVGRGFTTMHKGGTPGTPGTPMSIQRDPNYDPFASQRYGTAFAGLKERQDSLRRRALPAMEVQTRQGTNRRGYSEEALDRGLARDEAAWNRDFFLDDEARREAKLAQVMSLIAGMVAPGSGAAQAMQSNAHVQSQIAQQQRQQQVAGMAAMLAPLFMGNGGGGGTPGIAPGSRPAGPPLADYAPIDWTNPMAGIIG